MTRFDSLQMERQTVICDIDGIYRIYIYSKIDSPVAQCVHI